MVAIARMSSFSPCVQLREVPVPRYPDYAWEIRTGGLLGLPRGKDQCRQQEFASEEKLRTRFHT